MASWEAVPLETKVELLHATAGAVDRVKGPERDSREGGREGDWEREREGEAPRASE